MITVDYFLLALLYQKSDYLYLNLIYYDNNYDDNDF